MGQSVREKTENFFSRSKLIRYDRNEKIIRADEEEIYNIYYLKSGYVRQYLITGKGEERTVNIFRSHSYFPVILPMNNLKNRYSFDAMTEVEVYRCDKDKVLDFLQNNNDVLYELAQRLGKGLDALASEKEYFCGHSARLTVVSAICNFARRFGNEYEQGSIIIRLPLLHRDLASITGMSRESVSREVEKLEKTGLITRSNKHFIINNPGKMQSLLTI